MSIKCKYLALGMCCLVSFPLFSQGVWLELSLSDTRSGNPFALQKSPLEVFRVIEKATNDKKVKGIVLNIGSISSNREHLWELRSALEKFKAEGKKICAFISNANIDVYTLASVADKIVMDDLGTLSMLGYVAGRGYVHHTLEKLGIGVRELRYFEYKSAAETFTRDSMSEADRRQYNDYLDDIFGVTRNTLLNARNWTEEEFDSIVNSDFLYSARGAQSRGLVDRVGRKDAVLEAVKEIEGIEDADKLRFVLYGNTSASLTSDHATYTPPRQGGLFRRPPIIAVVYANGQTDMQRGMEALKLSSIIREQADRRRVKAIVIRIDSPGGSAEAADHFSEAVRYAKQKKPVIVSMGQVAASGGYWAAMNANHIIANPYTVTGSIGVIGSWFFDNGLNSKIGMNTDIIQRGNHADLMSGILLPYRNLTEHEEERYRQYIMDIYNVFIERVAAGREMDIEKVEAAAQGRIFSGIRALEAGLVDSVGGLPDALQEARQLAGIREGRRIRYDEFPKPKFIDRLLDSFPMTAALFGENQNQAEAVSFFAGMLIPSMDILYRLQNNGKVMPILPLGFVY
jgi:protease-4